MLFKILHGDASRISIDITPYHEGYCYVTYTGDFYVDMNGERTKLNAKDAETLTGMSLEEIKKSISWNDLLDRPFGEDVALTELFGGTANIASDGDVTVIEVGTANASLLKTDLSYYVKWDGKLYQAPHNVNYEGIGNLYYGSYNDADNNGLPFFICASAFQSQKIEVTAEKAGTHEFIIYSSSATIKQLDEKYIPDTIARTADIKQSDWSQSDPTSIDYIKNRTHFDKFSNATMLIDVNEALTEQGLNWEVFEGEGYNIVNSYFTSTVELVAGSAYGFVIDGKEYKYVSMSMQDAEQKMRLIVTDGVVFGDVDAYIMNDTEELQCFCMTYSIDEHGMYEYQITIKSDTAPQDCKIYHYDVMTYKLDERYLPNSVATKEYVLDAAVQPDWNQTDETAKDYIRNKPTEETSDDAMDLLAEIGVLSFVADEDGSILTDENNNILTI